MESKDDNTITVPVELLPPQKTVEDILVNIEDIDEQDIKEKLKVAQESKKRLQKGKVDSFASKPSMIISDWLFLGNARDAYQLDLLKALGITHILNVTREVCNYHILNKTYPIKYAQLIIDDHTFNQTLSVYDYLEATKAFIDECNPLINNNGNKILVHCAAGKSRSSTIIIAYLMSSVVNMNENELKRIQYIRECLSGETFVHQMKDNIAFMMKPTFKIFSEIEKYLNEIQKQTLGEIRDILYNEKHLKLNEAYYFVKSCRALIGPNIGFCAHLKRYEILYKKAETTICDLPTFTDWDNDTIVIWRGANEKYAVEYPEITVNNACCCCVVL
eukprot:368671_1